jgi:TPR repeat protein
MAAELGDAVAADTIGNLYYWGRGGVSQDFAAAARWFRKAAERDNPDAQYNLGVLSEEGRGVKQDYSEAIHWYGKAALQGIPEAYIQLSRLFDSGHAIPREKRYIAAFSLNSTQYEPIAKHCRKKIVAGEQEKKIDYLGEAKWYEESAHLKIPCAENTLAYMYENGLGEKPDLSKAINLYKSAAEQNYAIAQHNLGNKYLSGIGVPKDNVEAYFWYRLAAKNDYHFANSIQSLSAVLTPAQFKDVGKRLQEWKPSSK